METLKQYWSTLPALLSGVAVLIVADVGAVMAQASKDRDVVIVNTSAQPVPTTVQTLPSISGSVSITNTPTVNLQPGATVGISPAGNVVRVGGVVSVSDADNPARQPAEVLIATGFTSGSLVITPNGCIFVSGTCIGGTVPPGKRLVIESAGADVRLPSGQKALVSVFIGRTTGGISHPIPVTGHGTFAGQDVFHGSQALRMYADPGTTISAVVQRDSSSGDGSATVTFSGYFVDIP